MMPAKGSVAVGLRMREKQAIIKEAAKRYRRTDKGQKMRMLDELVTLTGYNRSYAARALRERPGVHPKKVAGWTKAATAKKVALYKRRC